MKNHSPHNDHGSEALWRHGELPVIEEAGIQLLHMALIKKRRIIEDQAEAYAHQIEGELSSESLASLLGSEARDLQQLIRASYNKENDFYHSWRGRGKAVAHMATRYMKITPNMPYELAVAEAKRDLDWAKKIKGTKFRNRKMGKAAIAPPLEMPPVCRTEGELIGEDVYAEQFYRLQFAPSALKVNYVISDRHDPGDEIVTELYELSMSRYGFIDHHLESTDRQPVSEQDHYFVLGLIRETASFFNAHTR